MALQTQTRNVSKQKKRSAFNLVPLALSAMTVHPKHHCLEDATNTPPPTNSSRVPVRPKSGCFPIKVLLSSCSHPGDSRSSTPTTTDPWSRSAVRTDSTRRGQPDLVGGSVETRLIVDRRQDLVDVGLEHHAAHYYFIQDVVDL